VSVAYIGPKSRTERPRKIKIGTEVTHVTCDSDTTFKVKRSKVKVTRPLRIMNIHGARRAGRLRHKACMGWSRVVACGVQERGHIARLPAQLVYTCSCILTANCPMSDLVFSITKFIHTT